MPGWTLRFHKRGFLDHSGKCNIVRGNGRLFVAVYEISTSEKTVLDRIEGVGKGYHAVEIDVPDFGDCHTYLAAGSHIDDGLQPFTWYRALVLAGCEYLDFPAEYAEAIRAVDATVDPDTGRHDEHMSLVDRLTRHTNAPIRD